MFSENLVNSITTNLDVGASRLRGSTGSYQYLFIFFL